MQYLLHHNLYLTLILLKPINYQAEEEASLFLLTQKPAFEN
jgi:hypothetical protein